MKLNSKMSRRELAAWTLTAAAASAQPAAPAQTAAAPAAAEIEARRAQMKRSFEQLAKLELPMATEPAAQFHA